MDQAQGRGDEEGGETGQGEPRTHVSLASSLSALGVSVSPSHVHFIATAPGSKILPCLSAHGGGRRLPDSLCSPGGDSQPVSLGRRPPWAIPLALPVQQPRLVVETTLNFSVT